MVFFMMTNRKQQCYPWCFFHDDQRKTTVSPLIFHLIKTTVLPPMFYSIHFDSVTPYGFFMMTDKNDSVTLYVHLIKTTVLPLMFFSHDDWWKTTVLPLIFYLTKTTVLPFMFFFMTTNKKRQCYPLCFFSWRPIKNYSVTPYVFFHDDQ